MTHLVDDYSAVPMLLRKADTDSRTVVLSNIIKMAHSADDGKIQEAALKLWEFLNSLSEEQLSDLTTQQSVSGPLAHLLAKLVDSTNPNVLLNSARILKTMMRDDSTRIGLCKAGLSRAIIARLILVPDSPSLSEANLYLDIKRELLAAAQNILVDSKTAPDFAGTGGLRAIGDGLLQLCSREDIEYGHQQRSRVRMDDPDIRVLLLACACNAFSYCDTILAVYIHEMRNWIEPICQIVSGSRISESDATSDATLYYATCCLANATRDPGLTHALRAANGAEVLNRCRHSDPRTSEVATVALGRLELTLGPRNDPQKVWRFRWGGGKSDQGVRVVEILGLLSFLLVVTVISGMVILAIFRLHSF